jgi:V8-like Glu-specific endopeptidase
VHVKKLVTIVGGVAVFGVAALVVPQANAIVNGQPAAHLDGAVQIQYEGNTVCGGTLIDDDFVLSAGHCFVDNGFHLPTNNFRILVGNRTRGAGDQYGVQSTFQPGNSGDIIMVKLSTTVTNRDHIREYTQSLPPQNASVSVRGWATAGDLQIATMRVNAFDGKLSDGTNFGMELKQEGAQGGYTEKGDSGGPVLYDNKLVGVIAEDEDDPGEEATWAIQIKDYYTWIGNTIINN